MGAQRKVGPPAALEGVDWVEVYQRLFVYGVKSRGLTHADAEEVAQEALRRLFDPEYANWDQDKYPTLGEFLKSVVNGVVSNIRQRSGHKAERISKDGNLPEHPSQVVSQEDRAIDAQQLRSAINSLLERADGDNLVQDLILKVAEGIDAPKEQAKELGVSIEAIYKARSRLNALIEMVKATLEDK